MDLTTAGDYEDSFGRYGESPKALHWANYRVPAVRFRELVQDLPIEGKRILDAGCGMGDLLPFLYAKSPDFSYLGMDINADFIDIARRRYEGHEFKVGNPFNDDVGKFDIVISSGVLNGNVENWMEKRKKAIKSLFDKSEVALAFNMSGSFKPIPNTPITAFADTLEIVDYCSKLTPKLIVRAHYTGRGFAIIMFR